jgi:hypothetical protein
MSIKKKKKFCIIAKINTGQFVKYRSNNLDNFFIFLNKKYSVYYANVFSNTGLDERKLIYTYGKNKGLQPAYN